MAAARPVHLVDENGAYLCPEAEARDAMDDGEFWEHILLRAGEGPDYGEDPELGDIAEWELTGRLGSPCPECGQPGACAYDTEGRALIHVTEENDCG